MNVCLGYVVCGFSEVQKYDQDQKFLEFRPGPHWNPTALPDPIAGGEGLLPPTPPITHPSLSVLLTSICSTPVKIA